MTAWTCALVHAAHALVLSMQRLLLPTVIVCACNGTGANDQQTLTGSVRTVGRGFLVQYALPIDIIA